MEGWKASERRSGRMQKRLKQARFLHSACAIAYDVGLLKSTFGATLADSGAVNKG